MLRPHCGRGGVGALCIFPCDPVQDHIQNIRGIIQVKLCRTADVLFQEAQPLVTVPLVTAPLVTRPASAKTSSGSVCCHLCVIKGCLSCRQLHDAFSQCTLPEEDDACLQCTMLWWARVLNAVMG